MPRTKTKPLYEIQRGGKEVKVGRGYDLGPPEKTVDCEPTWESVLLMLVEETGVEPERAELALGQLRKMARAADAYRALQKAGKVP